MLKYLYSLIAFTVGVITHWLVSEFSERSLLPLPIVMLALLTVILVVWKTNEVFARLVVSLLLAFASAFPIDWFLQYRLGLMHFEYVLSLASASSLVAVGVFFLGDFLYYLSRFRLSKDELRIREGITYVLAKLREMGADQKAQLALTLILLRSEQGEVALPSTLGGYFRLLGAGVRLAQTEWFATYLLNISEWSSYSTHAVTYNTALRNADLDKLRCVIASQSDIDGVSASTPLVKETTDAGSYIRFISVEHIEAEHPSMPELRSTDFAIFDVDSPTEFAVTAIAEGGRHFSSLGENDPVIVRVVKGSVGQYRTIKKYLTEHCKTSKAFPPARAETQIADLVPEHSVRYNTRRLVQNLTQETVWRNPVFSWTAVRALDTCVNLLEQMTRDGSVEVEFFTPFSLYDPILQAEVDQIYATSLVQTESFWKSQQGRAYWELNKTRMQSQGFVNLTRVFIFKDFRDFQKSADIVTNQVEFKYFTLPDQQRFKIYIARLSTLEGVTSPEDFAVYHKSGQPFCAVRLKIDHLQRTPVAVRACFNAGEIDAIAKNFRSIIDRSHEITINQGQKRDSIATVVRQQARAVLSDQRKNKVKPVV